MARCKAISSTFIAFLVTSICVYQSAALTMLLATKILQLDNATTDIQSDVKILKNRYSILEVMSLENRNLVNQSTQDVLNIASSHFGMERVMCLEKRANQVDKDTEQSIKKRIKDAIGSTLRYYEAHIDALNETDYTAGLAILKAIDDENGAQFQSKYPLLEWISQICTNADPVFGKSNCLAFGQGFQQRGKHWGNWVQPNILATAPLVANVGSDPETIWPVLNHECINALVSRCEVPHVCNRVMFDPVPQSQYMLTHQLLHRIFAQNKMETCGLSEDLVDEQVNRDLCSKMLQEAKLITDYGTPFIYRDLFAEHLMFCGFTGYPNFFRDDWLNMILSWQSKSEYGCFLKVSGSAFNMGDTDIPRMITERERRMGIKSSDEICQAHFTSVALSALAVAWDYLEDNCVN